MSTVKKWQTVSEEDAGDFGIFDLQRISRTSPRTGVTSEFVAIESPDWCNILPITKEGNVVVIRQYRHGTDSITIEVPAGIVEADEPDPLEAAKRELLEETGYSAENVVKIGVVEPNPAFLSNQCHLYLALGAHKIQEPQLGSGEDIATEEIPLAEFDKLIESGEITHSLVIANMYYFGRYCTKHNLAIGDQ